MDTAKLCERGTEVEGGVVLMEELSCGREVDAAWISALSTAADAGNWSTEDVVRTDLPGKDASFVLPRLPATAVETGFVSERE